MLQSPNQIFHWKICMIERIENGKKKKKWKKWMWKKNYNSVDNTTIYNNILIYKSRKQIFQREKPMVEKNRKIEEWNNELYNISYQCIWMCW